MVNNHDGVYSGIIAKMFPKPGEYPMLDPSVNPNPAVAAPSPANKPAPARKPQATAAPAAAPAPASK